MPDYIMLKSKKIQEQMKRRYLMSYTACFTGHRPQSLMCGFDETHPACIKIKNQLERLIIGLIEKKNVTHFISGVALGVDTWAAEIVLELKDNYPNITLEAAIPCRSQADRWNIVSKKRYNRLLLLCDKVTYVNEAYTKNCMMERNIYMVDNSDYVVAVWNGKPSGTGKTVEYAVNCGKDVFYVDPNTFLMKNIKF